MSRVVCEKVSASCIRVVHSLFESTLDQFGHRHSRGGHLKLTHRVRARFRLNLLSLFVLCTLFASVQQAAYCEQEPAQYLPEGFQSKVYLDEEGEHRYLVFVPSSYRENKKWPVVLFLHGAGQKGTDGIRPAIAGLGTALAESGDQPFIAVFPQCENLTGRHLTCWLAGSKDTDRALKILEEVERNYSINSQQRTLCGWSMGGYGAWSVAAADPDHWAGVLSISGGETERKVPLEKLAKSETVVWAVHGEEDSLIPFVQEERLIGKLKSLGGQGVYTLEEGLGHSVWRYLFSDPRTMQWLANPTYNLASEISHLSDNEPLPQMSQFYIDHYTHLETLPKMLSLRMGNEALEVISKGIPEAIPASALSGKLEDIERTTTSGDQQISVKLSDITFDCQIASVDLQAVSGGRFLATFGMNPLSLKVGRASLHSASTNAQTGSFEIRMGHRDPVTLELEIQPAISEDGLKLLPLKKKFTIPDSNWHIVPPQEINVDSDEYSEANIITGIVGGLYLQKSEIEKTVLEVIPSFLKIVESELQSRDAPKLASLLWPLPALIPDLAVSPSQVRTDPNGISLVFDLHIRTSQADSDINLATDVLSDNKAFEVSHIPATEELDFRISLGAVDGMGRLVIQEGFAYINVQDMQNERFAALAQNEVLTQIFPETSIDEALDNWEVGLRLEEPFQIRSAGPAASPTNIVIELFVPKVAFEVRDATSRHVAKLYFSLRQKIQIETFEENSIPQSLKVTWQRNPQIAILESGENSPVNRDEFEDLFVRAWEEFSQTLSGKERPVPRVNFGKSALGLKGFTVEDGVISLKFIAMRAEAE